MRAQDGHFTSGGEFEGRAAFVKFADLPSGMTKGLAIDAGGLVVFGTTLPAPTMPAGVRYQQISHTDSVTTLAAIPSWTRHGGKIYAVAKFADGELFHFYDGLRVTSWETEGYPYGTAVRTLGSKVYAVAGPLLHFSGVGAPTAWGTATTGAGFIDMSTQAEGSEELNALARYQSFLAIFAEKTITILYLDPDPANLSVYQELSNIGTISPRSVTQFGDADVFFLDQSGLRSLKARDSSNAAATTDIGVPVDPLITTQMQGLTEDEKANIIGVIEPVDGRFWLIVKDTVYVLSYFGGSKVSAWSTYTPSVRVDGESVPFTIDDAVVYNRRLYVRAGDVIYTYGGTGAQPTYDETEPELWLPYLDGDSPTEKKFLTGIDVSCVGSWQVRVGMSPQNTAASDLIGVVSATTFEDQRVPAEGRSTHFSLRFKGQGTGRKLVSSSVLHFERDAKGGDDS